MYPSKFPTLYVLHILTVACCVMACIYFGVVVAGNPLAILAILALQSIPDFPLVLPQEPEEEFDPGYHGADGGAGFMGSPESRAK